MGENIYEQTLDQELDQPQNAAQQQPNPYLETIDAVENSRTHAMRNAVVQAHDKSPDQAAKVRKLSELTGLAPDLVERNFDRLSKRQAADGTPYAKMLEETPVLSEWATDPTNAAIAKDDLEQLGTLEWIVTAPQRAFARSLHHMRVAELRAQQLYRTLTQEEQDALNAEKFAAEAGGKLGVGDSWFRGAVTGGGELLANILGGLASAGPKAILGGGVGAVVGAAGGSLAGGVGAVPGAIAGAKFGATAGATIGGAQFGFELEAGLALDEFLDPKWKDEYGQAMDPDVARGAAFAAGAMNAGLEVVGLGILARSFPGIEKLKGIAARSAIKEALKNPTVRSALKDAVKSYGGVLTGETAVEVAQRAVTIMAGEVAKQVEGKGARQLSAYEITADLASEAAGALSGFALLAPAGPLLTLSRDIARVQRSDQAAAFFQALSEGATASKTIERMPEAAQEFLERATANGPIPEVYAPTKAFREYFQGQGMNPDQVAAELTGRQDALEEAERTGGDLAIKTSVYGVRLAGTPHHQALAAELRLGPDEMNAREAAVFRETVAAELEKRKGEAAAAPAAAIQQQLQQQLEAAGFPAATAGAYAQLYQAAFGAMAERAGVDATELFARYGLTVQAPSVQEAAPAGRTEAGGDISTPSGGEAGGQVEALLEAAIEPTVPTSADPRDAQPAPAPGSTVEPGAPPDPDAPLDVSDPVRAALAMMRENPNITREAEQLRARAAAARAPAPKRDGTPATPGVESQPDDASAADAATTGAGPGGAGGEAAPAAPEGGGLPDNAAEPVATPDVGVQPEGSAADRPPARRRRQVPISQRARAGALLADAKERGYTGTDRDLVDHFLERYDTAVRIAADLEAEANLGGWRSLLTRISQAGGIGLDAFENDRGETMVILDLLAKGSGIIKKSGRHAFKRQGQRVLPNSVGIKGAPGVVVRKGGRSWDDMRDLLATDPDFPAELRERWENLTNFQEDVQDAAIKGRAENKGEEIPGRSTPSVESVLEDFLEVRPGTDWWQQAPANLDQVLEAGDVTFDVAEFNQNLFDDLLEPVMPAVDTLDTGEQQPRLPGDVGDVRETEVATPAEELPFALTNEVAKRKGKQTTLFQSAAELTKEGLAEWVADVKRRSPEVVEFDVYLTSNGDLELDTIATGAGLQNQGHGTRVMQELTAIADRYGKRIILSPAQRGYNPVEGARPTTSYARLVAWYRRFGFVRNAGRNRDFTTLKGMIRNPRREFFQSAFHGSPHVFEKFSLQAIGSGEGAQVYGWGLYFTDTKEIAEYYRDVLTNRGQDSPQRLAADAVKLRNGDAAGAAKFQERRIAAYERYLELDAQLTPIIDAEPFNRAEYDRVANERDEVWQSTGEPVWMSRQAIQERIELHRQILAAINSGDFKTGRLFEVEIPDGEEMLQWDLPASQQPAKVQQALRELGLTWQPFKLKTIGQMSQWLNGPTAAALAREDIGIRETLGEAFRYVQEQDEVALRNWQWQHQGLFNQGAVDPTGSALYDALKHQAIDARYAEFRKTGGRIFNTPTTAEAAQHASELLAKHGVPGIRYLDGSSRRAGKGGYNYVVFDDALVEVKQFYQPFFHGSPHDIKGRFSTKYVGSGEGAASFGWGLYFAENPVVAASYFDQLSDDPQLLELKVGTLRVSERNGWDYTKRAHVSDLENVRAALTEDLLAEPLELMAAGAGGLQQLVMGMLDVRAQDARRGDYTKQLEAIETLRRELSQPGALRASWEKRAGGVYKVEIADEAVARFIDWDAPFAQQPEAVKAAAAEFDPDIYNPEGADFDADETGQWLYYRVARTLMQREQKPLRDEADAIRARDTIRKPLGKKDLARMAEIEQQLTAIDENAHKAASLWFAERGVPGLRYLDQGSRTAGEGSRNVVVFDDSVVTLTHKDGTPVTAAERAEYFQDKEERVGAANEPVDKRGSITIDEQRRVTINLFAQRDLSTFLHEGGHFFLEVMGDLVDQIGEVATKTPQQQALLSDYQALLEWLGVKNRYQITTEHHEKFARAFEVYLMEGNAPSLEMRDVFSRFRAWLVGIYKAIGNLGVRLNDDVRAVMDRMLATDQALAEAKAAGHVAPMFLTAADVGMSESDFELYKNNVRRAHQTEREKLEQRLLSEVHREQQQAWKDRRAEVEADVTAKLAAEPVYRALEAMRTGRTPDGRPLMEGELEPLKLSKKMLVDQFGKARVQALPRPAIYSVDGGLDPDGVAQTFGFDAADGMLVAIEKAVPFKQAVQAETDRRMLEEHGSVLLDGSLLEEAQAAIANEDREILIRAELRALAQLRRQVQPFERAERAKGDARVQAEKERTAEAQADAAALRARARGGAAYIRGAIPNPNDLREMAQRKIRAMPIGEIKPAPFWSASRRAAQRAVELAARQDLDGAIVAKQQELINLALYREATTILEDVDKRVRKAKSYGTPAARARFGTAGDAYLDQVDGILDRYEFTRVSAKVLARRASIARFLAALDGEGLPVDLPPEVLEDSRRINYRQIPYEELVGITDGLEQLAHLARLKNKLLRSKEQRELDALANDLSTSIRENARGYAPPSERDRRPSTERRRSIADFFGSHRKLASLLRQLDGFLDGGQAWSAIMRPLNEAGSREAEMQAEATRKFSELLERAFPGAAAKQRLYDKTYLEPIGQSLSRMERLVIAMNWGNEGNRDRVRRSEGWSDAQVQAILDTLSGQELRFVQEVLDFIGGYWPQIAEKEKRVTGLEPERVEAVTIRAAGGEIRGGYFPLKYDDRLSAQAMANVDLEGANLAKAAAHGAATTRRGHTKARAEKVKLPIRRDFGVIWEHVNQVIHDLSHHETLIDVTRILNHRDVQSAILERYGDRVFKQIRNTIRDVAIGDVAAINGFERAVNHVRMGATVAALGWKLSVSAMQLIGLTNSMVRVGPRWVAVGVGKWIRHPTAMVETVEWIQEVSPFMRSRARTMQREIVEIRNQVGVESGTLKGWVDRSIETVGFSPAVRQGIADSYFWTIQKMQQLVDVPTWLGAYEKALNAGETEERAIAMADQAVLDSQGGGQIKDLAAVQRGGPMMKLWTNFYSFFNVLYNQAVESGKRANLKNPAEVGRLASDYFLLFIAPATLGFFLREALSTRERDEEPDELLARLALENVSYLAGTMLGVREVAGVLSGAAGYEGPAGARAFSSLSRLGVQVGQVVKAGEEWGEALDAALIRSLNDVAGVLLHYPASQSWNTIAGIVALAEGKTDNPAAVISGPPPKGR